MWRTWSLEHTLRDGLMSDLGGATCTLARAFAQWRCQRYRSSITAQLRSGLTTALQKAGQQEERIVSLQHELEASREQLGAASRAGAEELERATDELKSVVVTQHQLVDRLDDFKARLEAESAARRSCEEALRAAQHERVSVEAAARRVEADLLEATAARDHLSAALGQRDEQVRRDVEVLWHICISRSPLTLRLARDAPRHVQLQEALQETAAKSASADETCASSDISPPTAGPACAHEAQPQQSSVHSAEHNACSAVVSSDFVVVESSAQLEPGGFGVSCLAAATSQRRADVVSLSRECGVRKQLECALRRVRMLEGCQQERAQLLLSAASSRAAASATIERTADRCCAAQQMLVLAAWRHVVSRSRLTGRVHSAEHQTGEAAAWLSTMQQRIAIYVSGRVAHAHAMVLAATLSRWRLHARQRVRCTLSVRVCK